jgi:tetratricopeptide (TPR) repeat protein
LAEHHAATEKKQAPTLEDTLTTSFAMHNKAVLEMVNGIFKYAVYYFKEAADIKETLLGKKHNSVIETMEQLAVAMYGMEAYDQCHSTLRSIHSRCTSRALAARTWNAIAVVHFQKGEYDFAFKCAKRATIKYEESELSATIARANLGYMQISRGEPEGKATLESAGEVSYGSNIVI